ncbi:DUF2637 domain-containing protein [uncultured Citricoccus sp.]|uniref:DUF2637 domain-containing protein n=1 Tax=uncultured Citricoccus sp. TaxID=614031 RepID=UPI0026060E90|nr:DUF2637 domain-containing protein [uncultured Citricoccus sp.]
MTVQNQLAPLPNRLDGKHASTVLAAEEGRSAEPITTNMDQQDDPAASSAASPKRINPDDGRFIRLVVAGVVIAGLVAFAISFTALYEVAEWLGIPPFMWWAVPVFIDLAILVYAASVLVHKARGETTWPSWAALATFTALSVFANASHSLSSPQAVPWQGVVGAIIAGMVPVAIFVATEQLSRVAVEDPASRKAELREQAQIEQARAERERIRANMLLEKERHDRQMAHERDAAERAAELDRVRHQTEIAKLRAHREIPAHDAVPITDSTSDSEGTRASRQEDEASPNDNSAESPRMPLHVVTAPSASTPDSAARRAGTLDEVAAFVAQQTARGIDVTAAMLVDQFGLTERTSRRRLQVLREKQPEVFQVHHAEEQWREQG